MKRKGSAVLTVLGIIFVCSLVMGILVKIGYQNIHTSKKLVDRIKAYEYAEAGISETYTTLSTNWSLRLKSFGDIPYAEGYYNPTVVLISSNQCIIRSVGKCNKTKIAVSALFDYITDPLIIFPEYAGWGKTILAKGSIDLAGDTGGIKGSSHADKALILSGGLKADCDYVYLTSSDSITVRGIATTDGTLIAPVVTITGDDTVGVECIERAVEKISLPSIDLTKYYLAAEESGVVIKGGIFVSDADFTGKGVVWIDGDVTFKRDVIYDSIIIATGDIKFSGKATCIGTAADSKIISRDGTITAAGGCDIKGLIYAPGDITLSGHIRLVGSVLSGEDVRVLGTVDIIDYECCAGDELSKFDDGFGVLFHKAWIE